MSLLLPGCAVRRPAGESNFPDEVLHDALRAVGLTPADLTVRGDYLLDSCRLDITQRVLEHPLSGGDVAEAASGELMPPSAAKALALAGGYLGLPPGAAPGEGPKVLKTLSNPKVPAPLAEALSPLVAELARCRARVEAERDRFSPEDRRRLSGLVARVDPEQRVSETQTDSLLDLARGLDRGALADVAARLLAARDRFLHRADLLSGEAVRIEGGPVRIATAAGLVIIGGAGDDTYRETAALIVDLGGDDRYESGAGASSEREPVSLAIDLSGADFYGNAQGRGILGVGILTDLSGDDRYEGKSCGQGCGLAGIGILEDRTGDDRYRAGLGAQGFGFYGIGILCDHQGADRYAGDLLVQGAAGPGGAGILCDGGGDDSYAAGGRYRDFREDGAYFQSMAQGFGLGLRTSASGGIGILCDGGGDDCYRAGYFAQGAAFWAGMGMLIDGSGNDRYEARRYAQGCGVHIAAGVLLEGAGDDRYTLWGVGQGCGHDLSVGSLVDRSGDDRYRGAWLCQGAGNANGIGLLDDGSGDDRYAAERDDARGYGNPSRDYGSIGLFVDRSGDDLYKGPGGDGRLWTGGICGAGIDVPLK